MDISNSNSIPANSAWQRLKNASSWDYILPPPCSFRFFHEEMVASLLWYLVVERGSENVLSFWYCCVLNKVSFCQYARPLDQNTQCSTKYTFCLDIQNTDYYQWYLYRRKYSYWMGWSSIVSVFLFHPI